jgi:hypothetical protein
LDRLIFERIMKKDYFILELLKSGPVRLLLILGFLITLGIIIANRRKDAVQLKENVIYVAPKPEN